MMEMLSMKNQTPNKKLVFAPAVLGRLHFTRSSLRFTAPQQRRWTCRASSES